MAQRLITPVLVKEFRSQLRGSRAALLLTIYVGLALIAMRLVYGAIVGRIDSGSPIFSAEIGQALFIGLAMTVQTLTVFLAPAATVQAVSNEHERRTYDLLLSTPISATQLLLGKLIAGLCFVLLLACANVPLFSIVLLFGGVSGSDLVRVIAVFTITAITGGMLGLFCSVITRQTYSATLLCYALLVAVIAGTIFAANLYSATNASLAPPPSYVVGNPLTAMATALGRNRPPEIITADSLQPLAVINLLNRGTIAGGVNREVLPIYRATGAVYGAVCLLLFWLCLHLVQPLRRWRLGQADAVMLGLSLLYALGLWLSRAWWLEGLSRS